MPVLFKTFQKRFAAGVYLLQELPIALLAGDRKLAKAVIGLATQNQIHWYPKGNPKKMVGIAEAVTRQVNEKTKTSNRLEADRFAIPKLARDYGSLSSHGPSVAPAMYSASRRRN